MVYPLHPILARPPPMIIARLVGAVFAFVNLEREIALVAGPQEAPPIGTHETIRVLAHPAFKLMLGIGVFALLHRYESPTRGPLHASAQHRRAASSGRARRIRWRSGGRCGRLCVQREREDFGDGQT